MNIHYRGHYRGDTLGEGVTPSKWLLLWLVHAQIAD